MNKWLLIILLVFIVVSVGLGGYYFLQLGPKSPTILRKYISPDASPQEGVLNWEDVKKIVTSDCIGRTSAFVESGQGLEYSLKLFNSLGNVVFDNSEDSFVATSGKLVSIQPIDRNGGVVYPNNENCWVVWVGEAGGNGDIAYEAEGEKIKKYKVSNFPLPPVPKTIPQTPN